MQGTAWTGFHCMAVRFFGLVPQETNPVLGTAHDTRVGRLEEARAEPYSNQQTMQGTAWTGFQNMTMDFVSLAPPRSTSSEHSPRHRGSLG
jgi:hypothetical protein